MIGLKNMISHKYEGIRLEIIYEIAIRHSKINLYKQLERVDLNTLNGYQLNHIDLKLHHKFEM